MRFTRLIAGLTTAGLLGLAPVAISSPARATENLGSTTTATPSGTSLTYGEDLYFSTEVIGSDGIATYDGTVTLYAMPAGSTTWTPVATASPNYSIYDVKPRMNTVYKLAYSGYTAASTDEDTYAGSESAPFEVKVARKLSIKNPRGTLVKGKVAPTYKKKKIVIFKKVGKKWKKFRTLKTNKKSRFSTTLPASRKRTFFRITVPGNSQFLTAVQEGSTISYRTAAARVDVS